VGQDNLHRVEVTILGQKYTLSGETEPARMLELAALVDQKMSELQQMGSSASALKLAIMAAINIAGDLYGERESWEAQRRSLEERADRLIGLVEEELESLQEVVQQKP
jgi:cell division protein ZapA